MSNAVFNGLMVVDLAAFAISYLYVCIRVVEMIERAVLWMMSR